jgi:hypothetical protein
VNGDLHLLRRFGKHLDFRFHGLKFLDRNKEGNPYLIAPTLRDELIASLLKIRNKDGKLVPLDLNRAQAGYSRSCTRKNIVLKARQLGITTYVAGRFFIHTITRPGTMTVQVAHNQESAEEIFRIVHRFWENLPGGMRHEALVTSRANIRQLIFPRLDSEYRVASAADENAGRGFTIHNLHCSEVARWPRTGLEALTSLRAAVPPQGEIVLESTANGAGGVFYEEWQCAPETGYTRHFFPWWFEEKYSLPGEVPDLRAHPLTPEEEALRERWGLSEAQIAYRRMLRATLRGLAVQEYAEDPVSCFRASGESVFDLKTINQRLEATADPLETRDNGRLTIWYPPQMPHDYIIGVDPAGGGTEGDYACAEVIDRLTGMQCAELCGHMTPRDLAVQVAQLARQYHQALLAVERNNHGHAVLAHLQIGEQYPNLYRQGKQAGWLTSALTRPAMIENLAAVLVEAPELFQSRRLLSEFRTFIRQPDGSSGASTGAHDDCVMAMAIAFAVRKELAGTLTRDLELELVSLS